MDNFTTNTYEMKRDILNFSKKICKGASKPETKFVADMVYGISKSKDILLSNIAEALDEDTKKAYTINRLSDNLCWDLDANIDKNYCNIVIDSFGENPDGFMSELSEFDDELEGELQKIAAKRNVSEVTRPQNSASKFDESDSPSKGYWNKRREALEVVARYPERAAATLQNWVKDA